jgi:mRNA-degrading endonuclease RelE of RelBE toxin-antitoxin system
MTWHADLSHAAERQLERFPNKAQQQIARAIDDLEVDPFRGDVISLKGNQWRGRYRKRVGRYRVIFTPHHDTHTIEISAILRRDEHTYR